MPSVPSFLFDFESEMQVITENEYARFLLSENLWWKDIARVRQTGKKREILAWLLSTAAIRSEGLGGNMLFEDMAALYQEYDVGMAGDGLVLQRQQVEDNDGNGFQFASEWSAQIGAQMAYWPQKSVAQLILSGETGLAYDGKPFFSPPATAHPLTPFRVGAGSYANLFTGSASGVYPGALPIDASVTLDVAAQNLSKAFSYIAGMKMPNGVDPRFLKVRRLMCSAALMPRALQLTHLTSIPVASAGGAGSANLEPTQKWWGLAEPIEIQEFSNTGTAADDTSWYLACESVQSTALGAIVYVEREPFSIKYYTGQGGGTGVDAYLDRASQLEWHCQGRNVAGYGHPYALFKAKAT